MKRRKFRARRDLFPIVITIRLNSHWFARIDWFLFKLFGKRRKHPCGSLSTFSTCSQPWEGKYMYLSDDKHNAICKCCGSTRIISSEEINLDSPLEY